MKTSADQLQGEMEPSSMQSWFLLFAVLVHYSLTSSYSCQDRSSLGLRGGSFELSDNLAEPLARAILPASGSNTLSRGRGRFHKGGLESAHREGGAT